MKILKRTPQLFECSEEIFRQEQDKGEVNFGGDWLSAFCYVLAPVQLLYLLWVLGNALKKGNKRLYFLARDGYLPCCMAQHICRKMKLAIECRYLYCSRYSLRCGEYWLLGEESLSYICAGGLSVTFEKMMRRAGLQKEEIERAAADMGFSGRESSRLSYEEIKRLRPSLAECSFFMERMKERAEKNYSLVTGYLKQEGLLEAISYAVVDSGWTGSIQRSLQRLLKSCGYSGEIKGYYFGMYEYAAGMNPESYEPWYFGPGRGRLRKTFFCNNLYECVFSSPEGMTRGYSFFEGTYLPILEGRSNPNAEYIKEEERLLQKYIDCYLNKTAEKQSMGTILKTEEFISGAKLTARLLSSFMGAPSKGEAKAYGAYLFDDDVTGEEKESLAAKWGKEEWKKNRIGSRAAAYLIRGKHPELVSAWPEASTALYRNGGGRYHTAVYKWLLYRNRN